MDLVLNLILRQYLPISMHFSPHMLHTCKFCCHVGFCWSLEVSSHVSMQVCALVFDVDSFWEKTQIPDAVCQIFWRSRRYIVIQTILLQDHNTNNLRFWIGTSVVPTLCLSYTVWKYWHTFVESCRSLIQNLWSLFVELHPADQTRCFHFLPIGSTNT